MSQLQENYDNLYKSKKFPFGAAAHAGLAGVDKFIPPHCDVLDIGGGDGRNSLFLGQKGFPVTLVDISNEGLIKARELFAANGLQITTKQLNIAQIQPSGSYGLIIFAFVLHHLTTEKAREIINQLQKITIPAGIHALSTFTKNSDFFKRTPLGFFPDPDDLTELYGGWQVLKQNTKTMEAANAVNAEGKNMVNEVINIWFKKPDTKQENYKL